MRLYFGSTPNLRRVRGCKADYVSRARRSEMVLLLFCAANDLNDDSKERLLIHTAIEDTCSHDCGKSRIGQQKFLYAQFNHFTLAEPQR